SVAEITRPGPCSIPFVVQEYLQSNHPEDFAEFLLTAEFFDKEGRVFHKVHSGFRLGRARGGSGAWSAHSTASPVLAVVLCHTRYTLGWSPGTRCHYERSDVSLRGHLQEELCR